MTDKKKLLEKIASRIEASAARAVASGEISESSPRLEGAIRIVAHMRMRATEKSAE